MRAKILNQNPNVSNDHTLRTLSAAQVDEEDFFCHITHKTWDSIIKDIRKNHERDIDYSGSVVKTKILGCVLKLKIVQYLIF